MKVNVLENEKEFMKIEIEDDLTLMNMLNENLWKQKGLDFSAYKKDHPYLSHPVLLVKSKNAKKAVIDAAEQIIEDVKDFRKQFNAALE
jgi:DNA-directed RNA polymerase subunit L